MRARFLRPLVLGASLAFGMFGAAADHLEAQSGAAEALGGVISSSEEGKMEGVVVTARRAEANFDVSVVSDAQGRYSFPRTHLQPGRYTLKMRAVGYDLVDPGPVEVKIDNAAALDLKLEKTKDLSRQLTSVEWMMSLPGTDEQKDMVLKQGMSCGYCHSLERIVKSRHNAEQFVSVIRRMDRYYPDGTMAGTEGRGRSQLKTKREQEMSDKSEKWGWHPGVKDTDLAAYLATINQSEGRRLPADLKMLPRPKGKATRVIITQYDMPRKDTVPHDLEVDSKGTAWYTDESRMFLGKMDIKTGVFKEYPLPAVPEGDVPGARDITVDNDDNPWFTMRGPGGASPLTTLNARTEELTIVKDAPGQFVYRGGDGKIWTGFGPMTRVDPKTKMVDAKVNPATAPNKPSGQMFGYQIVADSKGNPWLPGTIGDHIVGFDMKTQTAKFIPMPFKGELPRRGRIDSEDRYWFAYYRGDRIGMFDTKTEKFQDWPLSRKYMTPYTLSVPDKNGRVYTPSNTSDRLVRLDPKTGEQVEYLMPTRDFDTKKLSIDPISHNAVWMANTRNARIIKVEPID